jgi:hypothetical protein
VKTLKSTGDGSDHAVVTGDSIPPVEIPAPPTRYDHQAVRRAVLAIRLRALVYRGVLPLRWAAWVLERVTPRHVHPD